MQHNKQSHDMGNKMYLKFAIMILLSFFAMYILMYAMVDSFSNVFPNVNQFYMAGLMTMPMVLLELVIMGGMYMKKKLNIIIMITGCILGIGFYAGIRQQAGVGDRQFLKSMIPHHAAAILMGNEASVTDPEIKELIKNIITSQQVEIDQMKAKLKELDK